MQNNKTLDNKQITMLNKFADDIFKGIKPTLYDDAVVHILRRVMQMKSEQDSMPTGSIILLWTKQLISEMERECSLTN